MQEFDNIRLANTIDIRHSNPNSVAAPMREDDCEFMIRFAHSCHAIVLLKCHQKLVDANIVRKIAFIRHPGSP